jgi:hypothetical protein
MTQFLEIILADGKHSTILVNIDQINAVMPEANGNGCFLHVDDRSAGHIHCLHTFGEIRWAISERDLQQPVIVPRCRAAFPHLEPDFYLENRIAGLDD